MAAGRARGERAPGLSPRPGAPRQGAAGQTGDPLSDHPLPTLRWAALVWLAVYLPSYTAAYGVVNFLFLCNLGVVLTALGIWLGSPLLLSSQAVASMAICAAWALDAGARLLTGSHLFGFTGYMWDPQYPLFTRLLSLYHLVWPLVLIHCLRRTGYDRRGFALQAGIATLALLAGRAVDPALNMNFAHAEPFFGGALGPAPVHLAVTLAVLVFGVYGATHRTLAALLPPLQERRAAALGDAAGAE